jgi:hypothetical protein
MPLSGHFGTGSFQINAARPGKQKIFQIRHEGQPPGLLQYRTIDTSIQKSKS